MLLCEVEDEERRGMVGRSFENLSAPSSAKSQVLAARRARDRKVHLPSDIV
jgi:hypothetical protein